MVVIDLSILVPLKSKDRTCCVPFPFYGSIMDDDEQRTDDRHVIAREVIPI
jgi:hypothetical protein